MTGCTAQHLAAPQAAINTLLTHDNIVNTYAYDVRAAGGNGAVGGPGSLPDDAHCWKMYIVQVPSVWGGALACCCIALHLFNGQACARNHAS
jgi:hypothetical protein